MQQPLKNNKRSTATTVLRQLDHLFTPVEHLQQAATHWLKKDSPASHMPLLIQLLGRLKNLNANNQLSRQSPASARANYVRSMQVLRGGFAVAHWRDLSIDLGSHTIQARHYQPQQTTQGAEGEIPALLLYLHGGGFVLGNLDTHDDICRFLCLHTGLQVLSVAYRLAPEHPFPAGLHDAKGALQWVRQHADEFAINPAHIALAGDSAGANYAAILSQQQEQPLLASLLIYPSTDRSRQLPSAQQFADSAFLSAADRQWFYRHYLGHPQAGADLNRDLSSDFNTDLNTDVEVSPLLGLQQHAEAANPVSICPTIVVTGGHDVLQDEGRAYAEQLAQRHVPVQHLHFERLDHGFMHFIGINKTCYLAARQIAAALRQCCLKQIPF